MSAVAPAAVLQTVSVSVQNSGGSGGSGASTTDMVYAQYNATDGWGWAGGAGGVQNTGSITNTGGSAPAANETLKFVLGSTVDTLNATYGVGNWEVSNPRLSFASSYSVQNNSRFGVGSGTFDIYWVANDAWAQSRGTLEDRQSNPVYASNAAGLLGWSGGQAVVGTQTFTVPSGGTGYVSLSYSLSPVSSLTSDILSASAGGANSAVSLYLMATSANLGMIIFTGGQSQALPTLSFDVVSVPEPATLAAIGVVASFLKRRRSVK
ncbi:MAG: PEP-CTERM sorting domain-containing protein [Tepidisphaeraceae bacterium]